MGQEIGNELDEQNGKDKSETDQLAPGVNPTGSSVCWITFDYAT